MLPPKLAKSLIKDHTRSSSSGHVRRGCVVVAGLVVGGFIGGFSLLLLQHVLPKHQTVALLNYNNQNNNSQPAIQINGSGEY